MKGKKKVRNKTRNNVEPEIASLQEEPIEIPPVPSAVEESEKVVTPIESQTPMPEVAKPAPIKADAPPEVPEEIKHPLENTWGFWLNTNESKRNWTDNQKLLTTFDTAEDYWCLYHHMKLPSDLKHGQDYAVFKEGISPMWEDLANKNGGRWVINLERRAFEINNVWLDVVLLLIGETLSSDAICGAVVNVKPKGQHRVSVWTRNRDESVNMKIGKQLKEMLRIDYRLQFLDNKNNALFVV